MKLTEVIQPGAEAIFESLKADTEHTFNDMTLRAISESVATFEQTAEPMTIDEFFTFLDNC
jgi:hypothetical protein